MDKYTSYLKRLLQNMKTVYKERGVKGFILKVRDYLYKHLFLVDPQYKYQKWIKSIEQPSIDIESIRGESKSFEYKPLISVIVPIFSVEPKWLVKAIDSVIAQTYENWELCLYDDASIKFKEEIAQILEEYAKKDKRIKYKLGKENQHISGSSNEAIKLASGEFLALLDNDDEVPPYAFYYFIKELNKNRNLNFIYSDEDKLTIEGKRTYPTFKPDWSPDTTLSMMYTTHLSFFRSSVVKKIGGFRKGYEGSQDYDLVLRFVEQISEDSILHIPRILYHWRMIPGSTAVSYDDKSYASKAAQKALEDTVKRRKLDAKLERGLTPPSFRVNYNIKGSPLVSIIVPTYNQKDLLSTCIKSLEEKSEYTNYELIIVDNNSDDPETLSYLKEIAKKHKVMKYEKTFNYSAINNFAVKSSKGEYILLLNNDTEIISSTWITDLLQLAQLDHVGAVGAKLLYPDDTIQHAGVYLGINGIAENAGKGVSIHESGWLDRLKIVSNISAVTGACLMVSKKKFLEVGGFNEESLAVAFNDVDLCLKLNQKGYKNIFTPFAQLIHHESKTRGDDLSGEKLERLNRETSYMIDHWGGVIKDDPYYNPNLTRGLSDASVTLVNNMFER